MGKALLDVLNGRMPERRPVWLMRQAGRYLPEYRAVREQAGSFLDLCYDPELSAEVTLQPLRRYDFDAAIVFSDILIVPQGMGLELRFVEGEGPMLQTVSDAASVRALRAGTGSPAFKSICNTLSRVRPRLQGHQTLIGFCGAPWTVASYAIEGGSSDRKIARQVAEEAPDWFVELMVRLIESSTAYLLAQIEAGAEVVQIFDSWAGELPGHLRERWVIAPINAMVEAVRREHPGFPVIVFARGFGDDHVKVVQGTAASAIGVEQGVNLGALLEALPSRVAVQGNLAPEMLLGDEGAMVAKIGELVKSAPIGRHIFNLGHGILQQTDPDRVLRMLEVIRSVDGGQR